MSAIDAIIAAALYVAAYLSFIHLLRIPRNWVTLNLPSVVLAACPAVLTVAWVSLSRQGLDPAGLVLSAGFIMAMFYVIAAPAIAFHPANRLVEFLARHGEHAGLWLFFPALAAGLAVDNIKLQAMLAVAMAIECSWSLRHHWSSRGGQLHPLTGDDLAVLKTQAGGDLGAFRRRHGIRELVLSGDDVSWRGCGKTTPPCPFNLYVNRLGLNTAPCCREHMGDICHYVAGCLGEIGAVYWLEGGSLLGAVREGGALLAWEDDVDISVLVDEEMTWDKLAAGLVERCRRDGYYIDLFERKDLISIAFDLPKPWPWRWEHNRLRGEIRVDLAVYRPAMSHGQAVLERQSHKGAMQATENGAYGIARDIVLPAATINFLGGSFACPRDPDAYLRVLYGDYGEVEYTYLDASAAETRQQAELIK